EPLKSASYLSRFAKLIRQNFDFIDKKRIVLSEEIDALENYLETQKMRYNDKFDYVINIFDNVDTHAIEIPPLLLQPFVENAIEHGFKRINETGKLAITIFKQQNSVCFEIKDNGIGFENPKNDNKKHAIDIFLKRLKLRGLDEEKSFKISTTEQGTTVKFCLKL
ncbi:MAG TPA: sensor histidine kinase, partial [Saprospiraceae bacterium]|nr:sensor histidine kinase [Saprospiraceae bacterium]